jgi:GT2 family glycosyltransferase
MDLSIVIVNWNTRQLLDRCLSGVFSTVRCRTEVIVVDNASADGSADLVRERYPQCILIRNLGNLGFARANNQGFGIAKGRHVLLLNSDACPQEGCLDGMVEFLDRNPGHGAVASRLIYEDGSLQRSCRRFPTWLTLVAAHSSLRFQDCGRRAMDRWLMNDWSHEDSRDVDQPAAACLLVRGETLRRVGFFDTGFFLLYNDVDLCWRIREAGYRIAYLASVRAVHSEGASLRRFGRLDAVSLRNALHYASKFYGPLAAAAFYLLVRGDAWRLKLLHSGGRGERPKS